MLIFSLQPFVASHLITVKGRSSLHVFSDHRLHAAFLTIPHDFGANLPATLNESHGGSFIVLHASGNAALLYAQVHVASFPSDVGFVYFDFAAIATKFRAEEIILHCEPDAMQHKPCRLLDNPQITRNFVVADSVLAVGDQPHRGKPFVQADSGILHDSADFDGELALRVMARALPSAALGIEFHCIRATTGAGDAFRPAPDCEVVHAVIRIREVDDCFLQALWLFAHGVPHNSKYSKKPWTSQVNYYRKKDEG